MERRASSFGSAFTSVIGIDEAGRGPLCGPVVAAACVVPPHVDIDGVCDSKTLTDEAKREAIYAALTSPDSGVQWFASACSPQEIDELNILQASLKAMRDACTGLIRKYKVTGAQLASCVALVDGNKVPADMPVACKCVVKGDSKVYNIAAASIIAKVTRDRVMHALDAQYPGYGLAGHKGYPVREHRETLIRLGLPAPPKGEPSIYRFSYRPVKEAHERAAAKKARAPARGAAASKAATVASTTKKQKAAAAVRPTRAAAAAKKPAAVKSAARPVGKPSSRPRRGALSSS